MTHTTIHIWYNELVDILHDEGIMIFIFFVPIFYPLLYAYIYTNEVVRDVPAVVVDLCNSSRSREFVRRIDGTPDVRITRRCHSMEEAREYLKTHEAYGIYQIPATFDEDIYYGRQTYVGTYCDMSSMLYYKALLLAATDVSLEMNKDIKVRHYIPTMTDRDEEIARTPVEYDHVAMYNPQGGFASFLIPPVMMLIIQQTMLLGVGMQMGRTRERFCGCVIPFNRHYKNPINIVIGKSMVYVMTYIVMGIYMFTFVTRLFQMPQLGTAATFLQFLLPYLLACVFFAMTLSSLIYRREDCILIFVFMSVPLLFLSGISWPWSAMPRFWKVIACLFPSTFGMNGYVHIANMGCSLSDIRAEYICLWIQTAFYFTTACLMYRRHIRQMYMIKPH